MEPLTQAQEETRRIQQARDAWRANQYTQTFLASPLRHDYGRCPSSYCEYQNPFGATACLNCGWPER